jgi:hypothetical protein
MDSPDQRLDAIEARLRAAEDELAVIRLVASYGPLVDSGSADLAPALFAQDGVYDVSYGRMVGHDAFAALLGHHEHQAAVANGIAHVMGLPWVRVDGDRAIAINCTQLFLREGKDFAIFRVAQNIWKCVRGEQGWTISERVNRLIGADDEARALIAEAI